MGALRWRALLAGVFLGAWGALVLGCGQSESGNGNGSANKETQLPGAEVAVPRIVSLMPSATSFIVAMGLEDHLVARAAWDDCAPSDLPVVHSTQLNAEALVAVPRTHVVVSSHASGPDRLLMQMKKDLGFAVFDYRYPESVEDALTILTKGSKAQGGDTPGLGEALGVPEKADALAEQIRAELAGLREQTKQREAAGQKRPRVLAVFSLDPLQALGPDTVVDELIDAAGGKNVVTGAKAVRLDHEALHALQPEVILVLKPKAPAFADGDPRLEAIASVPVPAVQNHRVCLINGPQCLLPGANMGKLAIEIAGCLHASNVSKD